jgi:S1-C subfamily serine protease
LDDGTVRITVVIVVAAAVLGGLAGAMIGLGLDGNSGSSSSTSASAELASASSASSGRAPEQIYLRDARAVVVITSTHTQDVPATFFTPALKERVAALGSGFVIDKHGDIVTNDHVVQGGRRIRIGFSNGATYAAHVVGADPSSDVAVVRANVPSSALHPLQFDNSSAVQVGDSVYAIGNPFGLDRTMTAGIVSATGRDIGAPNGLTIPNAIQTDAPINHGNSGGPLLDARGRVVGINDQIESGSVDGNVGIGFAVPSNTARMVAAELTKTGRAAHAWLGIEADDIDPNLTGGVRGLPSHGVVIVHVLNGSPAAKAGLRGATREVTVDGFSAPLGGDTIVAIDGKSVGTAQELADAVAAHKPGDRVHLTVVRAGEDRTVAVTLGNATS